MLGFAPLADAPLASQPVAGPQGGGGGGGQIQPLSEALVSSSSLVFALARSRALRSALGPGSGVLGGLSGTHGLASSAASRSLDTALLTRSRPLTAAQGSLSTTLSATHHTGTLASAVVSATHLSAALISCHALSGIIVSLSSVTASLPRARPLSLAVISLSLCQTMALLRRHVLTQSIVCTSTVYGRFTALAYTTYLDNALLAHVAGETAYPMPSNYMALFRIAPTVAGGGTETSYSNYARVGLSNAFGPVSVGSITNTATISLPVCGATGDTIVAFGAYDAPTAGNLLYFGSCAQAISYGLAPTFAPGALSVTQS